jgi:hypothetical protein
MIQNGSKVQMGSRQDAEHQIKKPEIINPPGPEQETSNKQPETPPPPSPILHFSDKLQIVAISCYITL